MAIDGNTVTLITVIVGFIAQWLFGARQHRWDAEDRERLAKEARADATAVETRITGHIADNTSISTQAFHEANSVNLKLHALGLEQLAIATEAHAAKPKP